MTARIIKLDIKMFVDKSWRPIYFGVKRLKVMSHKNVVGMVLCTLVSVGF